MSCGRRRKAPKVFGTNNASARRPRTCSRSAWPLSVLSLASEYTLGANLAVVNYDIKLYMYNPAEARSACGHSREPVGFTKQFLRERLQQAGIHLIGKTCDGEGVAHPVLDVENRCRNESDAGNIVAVVDTISSRARDLDFGRPGIIVGR